MDQRRAGDIDSSGSGQPTTTTSGTVAPRLGFGLALMLAAQFLVSLDGSIVAVALPHIQHDLGFSAAGVQTVVTAYNTAFGGALILAGRVGDLIGRRRLFIIGMVAFAAASLLCALAVNAPMLVIGRILQGFAAATIAPTALSLLTSSVPEGPARANAMSKFGIATVLGFVGGLVFSGILVDAFGWPSIFYVTVPVAIAVAVLTPRFVARPSVIRHRIDILGAILITAGAALIVIAPAQGSANGWGSPGFYIPLVVGLLLIAIFIYVERRQPEPLVRLGLFRTASLRTGNLVTIVAGFVSGTAYLMVTLYLQDVLGLTALEAALVVAPIGPVNIVFGTVLGKLINKFGLRTAVTTGTLVAGLLIGLVATQMRLGENAFVFAAILLPMGVAMMATMVTSTLAATSGVDRHEQGLAAGVRQTSFQLGIALGVAILLSIAATRTAALGIGAPISHAQALVGGYQFAMFILAALVVLASPISFIGLRPRPSLN